MAQAINPLAYGVEETKHYQAIVVYKKDSKQQCRTVFEVLEKAPEFDGHTSDDVLKRIKDLIK